MPVPYVSTQEAIGRRLHRVCLARRALHDQIVKRYMAGAGWGALLMLYRLVSGRFFIDGMARHNPSSSVKGRQLRSVFSVVRDGTTAR